MERGLFAIFAILSLVLVLVAAGTAGVSYWAAPVLAARWASGECELGCESGRWFVLLQRGHRPAPPYGLGLSAETPGIVYTAVFRQVDSDTSPFGAGSWTTGSLHVTTVWVPAWAPVATLAFLPALALRRSRRASRQPGGFPVTPRGADRTAAP